MSIQQLMLGVGASKKTYMDDVFSTDLYKGTGYSATMTNGINLSGEGGLVWQKARTNASSSNGGHKLTDTVRGYNKQLLANDWAAQTTGTTTVTGFTSTGFTYDQDDATNNHLENYASYTFRKAKGFFDVVTYTGDGGSSKTISHSLGSVPGVVMVKRTDANDNWNVYHRSTGEHKAIFLNGSGSAEDDPKFWNDTLPTSTAFTVGDDTGMNASGGTYVAYLFAGGESTAAGARSVSFDGNDDLTIASDSDFNYGTGDFTWELWVKLASSPGTEYLIDHSDSNNGGTLHYHGDQIRYLNPTTGTGSALYTDGGSLTPDHWHHVAVVRNSGTTTIYVDGAKRTSASDSHNYPDNKLWIARRPDGQYLTGSISNFRIVKGTAVYTSSFKPPTEPLTNITNTVLLCCQNSQASYATVSPSSITAGGDPTVSDSISPFDDPAAFTFGENGDQGIIKCGSYVGNETTSGPVINLGWEPQWILIKRSNSTEGWALFDSMRGICTGHSDNFFEVNVAEVEDNGNRISLTSTGFKVTTSETIINGNDDLYIYVAIRRPDGYVGKPAEAGTGVFDIAYGVGSSANPTYPSSILTDFNIYKKPAASSSWYVNSRLMQGLAGLITDGTAAESANSGVKFDYQTGMGSWGADNSAWLSWHWKRHAGFDVVTYEGNGAAGRGIPHSMSKIPEMIWVKYRSSGTYGWVVYHKGLNGGSSPENYYIRLDTDGAEGAGSTMWNDTAPTSTVFTVGTNAGTNSNTADYLAMLFSSVSGISKVGSYTGNGGTSLTIQTGFQPRFLMIKKVSDTGDWFIYDTVRGINSSTGGTDKQLKLNSSSAETDNDGVAVWSTSFTLRDSSLLSVNDENYIYYAHA